MKEIEPAIVEVNNGPVIDLRGAVILDLDTSQYGTTENSNSCEDCPRVIENPPSESDCPNFMTFESGRTPECVEDDGNGFRSIISKNF